MGMMLAAQKLRRSASATGGLSPARCRSSSSRPPRRPRAYALHRAQWLSQQVMT